MVRDLTDEICEKAKNTIINGRFGIKGAVERGKTTQEEMDKALTEQVPAVKFGFSQPIEMRVNELVAGVKSDVAVLIVPEPLVPGDTVDFAVDYDALVRAVTSPSVIKRFVKETP